MDITISTTNVISLVSLFGATLLFILRYIYTVNVRKTKNRTINFRWLGWFGNNIITGTSTDWYKNYMRKFNVLTVAMWACLLLAFFVFMFGKYYMVTQP